MSYSTWIAARQSEYSTALTTAYINYDFQVVQSGLPEQEWNSWTTAYNTMITDPQGSVTSLLPPASDAFGETPTATVDEITQFQSYLEDNPSVAAQLNLSVQLGVDSNGGNISLGQAGVVGGEFRRWKGQQIYTFANGVLVGKDSKLIAALGAGNGSFPEVGNDTLIYFDGIPGSRYSENQGVVAFGGDVVVSGSLQGTDGVLLIDDVIQLETGVHNPAGIAVDDDGKILLRHRGMGFMDFVDQDEITKNAAIKATKSWVGSQNTKATHLQSSLIPNSNFELIEVEENVDGNLVNKPAGIRTFGNTSSVITYATDGQGNEDIGVLAFDADFQQGIMTPAIPVEGSNYKLQIRLFSNTNEAALADEGVAQGIFLVAFESSDEYITATHVYDQNFNAVYESGVDIAAGTIKYLNGTVREVNGETDGWGFSQTPEVKTLQYTPTEGTNFVSFGVFAKEYNDYVFLDWISLTPITIDSTVVDGLIAGINQDVYLESDVSLITNSNLKNGINDFYAIGNSSLTALPDGGDNGIGDAAINVEVTGSAGNLNGVCSSPVIISASQYSVGVMIKADQNCTVELHAYENTTAPSASSFFAASPPTITNNDLNTITLVAFDNSGNALGQSGTSINLTAGQWYSLIGTYEVSGFSVSDTSTVPTTDVKEFSLFVNTEDQVNLVCDYFYALEQTISANVAQLLADQAYGDSQLYLQEINDALVSEQGSLIYNASMALPSSLGNGPAGYVADTSSKLSTAVNGTNKYIRMSSAGTVGSPIWSIGDSNSSDKYTIAIRAKANTGTSNIRVSVAYSPDGFDTNYISLMPSSYNSDMNVQETNVFKEDLIVDPNANQEGGANEYDWNVGTSYENIIVTWDRTANATAATCASILITGDAAFDVDYILVQAQSVSYDTATAYADDRKKEAIAQAEGYVTGLNQNMVQESNSILANASFTNYYLDNVNNLNRPAGYLSTRSSVTRLKRIAKIDDNTNYLTVQDYGQTGNCITETPNTNAEYGILCPPIQLSLPIGSLAGLSDSGETISNNGQYTIAVKVKNVGTTGTIKIRAHEYFGYLDDHTHCYNGSVTDYIDTVQIQNRTDIKQIAGGNGTSQYIDLINLTTNDLTVGNGTSYIEDFGTTWWNIGGTYTANPNAQTVCFEILIDSVSSVPTLIDYIMVIPQQMDADFANALAQSRANEAEDNMITESNKAEPEDVGNVLYNSNFSIATGPRLGRYPAGWTPIRYNFYGPLQQSPSFSSMSFAGAFLRRGLSLDVSSDNLQIISKPFQVFHDDYKIIVKIKSTNASQNFYVDVYESAQKTLTPFQYSVGNPGTYTQLPISPDNEVQCIVNTTYVSVPDDVIVANGTPILLTEVDLNVSTVPLTTSYQTFEFEYLPTTGTKYASVCIRNSSSSYDISVMSITCQKDTTGLKGFKNKSFEDIFNTARDNLTTHHSYTVAPAVSTSYIQESFTIESTEATPMIDMDMIGSQQTADETMYAGSVVAMRARSWTGGVSYWKPTPFMNTKIGSDGRIFSAGPAQFKNIIVGLNNMAGWSNPTSYSSGPDAVGANSTNNHGGQLVVWGNGTTNTGVRFADYNSPEKSKFNFGIYNDYTSASTNGLNSSYARLNFYYYGDSTAVHNTYYQAAGIVGFISKNGSTAKINFTGQHRCDDVNNALTSGAVGLIVVSSGNYNNLNNGSKPTINSSLPIVELATKRNQKSVFGVLSDKEDRNGNPREYTFGNFVSVHDDNEELDRLIINSLGEGAIWITNINGNLENGDYITSSEIPGYGMRQDDDLLHNYTVAKITQDCLFELDNTTYDCVEFEFEGNTYRKAFVGCTYHCG